MIGRNSVVRRTLDNLPESLAIVSEGAPDEDTDGQAPDPVEELPPEE